MTERPRAYIETTVVSYLAARPSRDLRVAAHQEITADWWSGRRQDFDVFISQLVVDEVSAGDPTAAARRRAAIAGLPVLGLTEAAVALAERLVSEGAVPREAGEDALHIAIAAVNGIEFLVTWNCKHIANATMRTRIDSVCVGLGYEAPVICTPEELSGE